MWPWALAGVALLGGGYLLYRTTQQKSLTDQVVGGVSTAVGDVTGAATSAAKAGYNAIHSAAAATDRGLVAAARPVAGAVKTIESWF